MFTLKTTRIARILAAATLATGLASLAGAQTYTTYTSPQTYTVSQTYTGEPIILLSQSQLETLTGSIALYPDALIAQMLPAATYPADVVQAARLIRVGVSAYQIDQYDFDPSVKAVAHYPTVIQMMDQNLAWTEQLGRAFIAQPGDVMQAIQALRWRAHGTGVLCTTPQQQVYIESSCIRIVPAAAAVIYVPTYDPAVCFEPVRSYRSSPVISFSIGYDCGSWFDLDIDWVGRSCYRPGWTWNNWRSHFSVDHTHNIRPRFDYHRHDHRHDSVWKRNNSRHFSLDRHDHGRSDHNPSHSHGRSRDDHDRSRDFDRPRGEGRDRDRSRGENRNRDGDRSRDSGQRRFENRAAPAPAHTPAPRANPAQDGPRRLDRGDQRTHAQPTRSVPRAAGQADAPRAPTPARAASPATNGPRRLTATAPGVQTPTPAATGGGKQQPDRAQGRGDRDNKRDRK